MRRRGPSLLLLLAAGAALIWNDHPRKHSIAILSDSTRATAQFRMEIRNVFALVEARAAKLRRAQTITGFARHYHINNRLATDIFEAAEKARVDPDLAFRLVRLESDFNERATSPVGAIGLTQVMPSTAQEWWDASITEEQLYDRRLNLRIGLSYLRAMLDEQHGDVMLALAAYNRGPGTVERLLAQGQLTSTAYERVIMRGYNGRGILE